MHLHGLFVHSKLVINQIIAEDDAIYQCQAENHLGSVLSVARLIVVMSEDRPSAPRNIQADTVSSSAILLAWERPLYNSDKVIAYSVHYMKAEGKFSNGKNGVANRNIILLFLISSFTVVRLGNISMAKAPDLVCIYVT